MNCELDYETVKAKELQTKNDNLLAGVNINKQAELKDREKLIAEYERRTHEIEQKMKNQNQSEANKISDEVQKMTIERLKAENAQLQLDLVNSKKETEKAK